MTYNESFNHNLFLCIFFMNFLMLISSCTQKCSQPVILQGSRISFIPPEEETNRLFYIFTYRQLKTDFKMGVVRYVQT